MKPNYTKLDEFVEEVNRSKMSNGGSSSGAEKFLQFLFLFFILTPYGVFAMGFVFMKLWSWFIVPTFHMEPLTILMSAGIVTFVRFATFQSSILNNKGKEDNGEVDWHKQGVLAIYPWFALLFGYIIFKLM